MLKEAVSWFWSYWPIKQDVYWRLKLLLPALIDEAPETAGRQFLNNTLEEQAAVDNATDVISGNTKQAVQSRKRSQHVSTTSIKHREEFSTFKICLHKSDGKCATRVGKLDTAASANVMSQAVFSSLGMNMEVWDGPALKPIGNGDSIIPLGKLNIDCMLAENARRTQATSLYWNTLCPKTSMYYLGKTRCKRSNFTRTIITSGFLD